MIRQEIVILVIIFVILSCVSHTNASVLGTIEYNRTGSVLGEFHNMDISISYPLITPSGFNTSAISLSWNITENDVGKTFFASAGTHDIFDSFAYMLTDGIDDLLFLQDICTIGSGYDLPGAERESSLIHGGRNGVDFEGYTINSISFKINELFFDYSIGGSTNYSYDITYTIYGEPIPEPATVCLLALGGVLLGRKRRD